MNGKSIFYAMLPEDETTAYSGQVAQVKRLTRNFRTRLAQEEINAAYSSAACSFERALTHLDELLRELFETEEALMIRTLYPDYEHQRDLHRAYRAHFSGKGKCPEDCTPQLMLQLLEQWFNQHELLSDRYFFHYLMEHEARRIRRAGRHESCGNSPEYLLLKVKCGRL